MVSLSNNNIGENVMFTGLLKYFTFTFLFWTYHTYNDLGKFPKSLENEFREDKKLKLIFNRLLAKHHLQSELQYDDLRDKLSDVKSIYGQIKKKPNHFEAYMNDYKRRYRKKNGLFKLDCYFEKKVFDKILYIKELSEKAHNDKKRFKKIFLKKYGIGLFFFALIPTFGFILPILFGVDDWGLKGYFPFCTTSGHDNDGTVTTDSCDKWHEYKLKDTISYLKIFNNIFSFTMITIILTFLIYIIIKLIKYEKLKAGKGKMNLMDYCRFCKDVFI